MFGSRLAVVVFCGVVLVGQIIFAVGIQLKIFWVCVVGRALFGILGDSMFAVQAKFVSRWFRGDQLSFVFGVTIAVSRLGSVINFALMPYLAEIGVPFALWIGTATCALSFFTAFLSSMFDYKAEKMEIVPPPTKEKITLSYILSSLKVLSEFNFGVYIIFFMCTAFYCSFVVFLEVGGKIMQLSGHNYDRETSSLFLMIPNLLGILLCPTFGKIVDKVGRAMWWVLVSTTMIIVGLALFLALTLNWFEIHPIIIMVIIGVSYSMFVASTWGLLPFVVPERMVGSAYGMMASVENLGYAVVPQIIGSIQILPEVDGTISQHTIPIYILLGCGALSTILGIVLLVWDLTFNEGELNAKGYLRDSIKQEINRIDNLIMEEKRKYNNRHEGTSGDSSSSSSKYDDENHVTLDDEEVPLMKKH
eukprot:TRINITY_DN765_c0_g1_i2.p1 TRINITY_DN765_c0_g1~~TRINITY_DN765_c0_g1_i2.p1  ORF type:complete len:419 (-),score=78.30 TRINITY_DN765_c0_g1_i2:121-1377(-)